MKLNEIRSDKHKSCGFSRLYTVIYFLPKYSNLLPTNYKIRDFVVSQNGANIHTSVPISG